MQVAGRLDSAVTDIYPASEAPIPGVNGAAVAEAIRRHGHAAVEYIGAKLQ